MGGGGGVSIASVVCGWNSGLCPPATSGLFWARVHHLCRYVDPIQTFPPHLLFNCLLDEA